MTATEFANDAAQLSLFPDPQSQKQRRLDAALDQISGRFGADAIRRGRANRAEPDVT